MRNMSVCKSSEDSYIACRMRFTGTSSARWGSLTVHLYSKNKIFAILDFDSLDLALGYCSRTKTEKGDEEMIACEYLKRSGDLI
jgi:hypothetical protein